MADVPTMKVKRKDGSVVVINRADFDAATETEVKEDPKAAKAEAHSAHTADPVTPAATPPAGKPPGARH